MNFAFSRAKVARVLLVEGDLRRPSFARKWLLDSPDQPGLAELAAGKASLEDCLLQVDGTDLHVILSGEIPRDSLALLESQRFSDTLLMLRENYDLIVIDCPPVLPVADALVIASMATGVIYVVRAGRTPIARVRAGLRKLDSVDIPVFGIVLNQYVFTKAERYYNTYAGKAAYVGDRKERLTGYVQGDSRSKRRKKATLERA